ncbi:MAG: SH3 domain-containing protein [Clostridia bacterium]|nr:SH3 domain-containing protein [Clostridia bacterium]
MKKILSLTLALLFICSAFAVLADDIGIKLNGDYINCDVAPFIVEGRTLVPLRAISEGMGYDVLWDGEEQSVTVNNNATGSYIKLNIGSCNVNTNAGAKEISVAPRIYENRTMVPIRVISETLGCEVYWDNQNRDVIITTVGTPYTHIDDSPFDVTVSGSTLYVVLCNENISLRYYPEDDAKVKAEIPLFDSVTFISDFGNGFYYVKYNDKYGFINGYYTSEFEPQVYVGDALVVNCNSSITLRSAANTSGAEIMQIPLGETVHVLSAEYGDFKLISYNGRKGWVLSNYLSDIK